MNASLHSEIQNRLLTGLELLDPTQLANLKAHLAVCPECSSFASSLHRVEPLLRKVLHERWDPSLPSNSFSHKILQEYRRKQMYEKVSSVSRSLAWVGILVLSAGFLVWSISVLVFKQPLFPQGIPEIFSPFSEPAPAASDLNLQPLDLGPDWALTMDETEFRPNTYWDIDETGLPMIGEHQNTSEPLFLPGDLETYSVRGYSNKDREAVVFASVVIFKEEARAVSLVDQMFPQMLQDSDIPEENQALQVAEIGAEETQAYLIQTQEGRDGLTRAASGGFHKGRVVFIFYVINYQEGGIPLSQDQLWELATTVEARIRTGQ